ncbi:MAG: hypothetical protein IH998_16345 [Proteobacteria bacterium]|nr:hypothetical protein [Pseudomonadota bacterium]
MSAAAYSQEHESVIFLKVSLGSDNRLRFEVPSTTDQYYVLYYRRELGDADTEIPVAMQFGGTSSTILIEQLGIGPPNGLYRVQPYRRDQAGDADGDGRSDVEELADPTGRLAPLNPADPIDFTDGVVAILDRQMFRDLSYQGLDVLIDTHLEDLEYVKFYVLDTDTDNPQIYFMNTDTHRAHRSFANAVGIEGGFGGRGGAGGGRGGAGGGRGGVGGGGGQIPEGCFPEGFEIPPGGLGAIELPEDFEPPEGCPDLTGAGGGGGGFGRHSSNFILRGFDSLGRGRATAGATLPPGAGDNISLPPRIVARAR